MGNDIFLAILLTASPIILVLAIIDWIFRPCPFCHRPTELSIVTDSRICTNCGVSEVVFGPFNHYAEWMTKEEYAHYVNLRRRSVLHTIVW